MLFPMTAVIQFKSAFRVFRGPLLPIGVPSRICGETRSAFPLRPSTGYYGLLRPITAKKMRNRAFRPWTQSDLLGPIGSYWDQKNVKTPQRHLSFVASPSGSFRVFHGLPQSHPTACFFALYASVCTYMQSDAPPCTKMKNYGMVHKVHTGAREAGRTNLR